MSARAHAFVVVAHGASPHLDECLASLAAQSTPSAIVVTTSTPHATIARQAAAVGAQLVVNPLARGIAADWNFALEAIDADALTLAHQDDVYLPDYARAMTALLARHPHATIAFSDYAELIDGTVHPSRLNLRIKRLLLANAFGDRAAIDGWHDKRAALAFGSPIACPAVTFNRRLVPRPLFDEALTVSLDWAAWIALAARAGAFAWERRVLLWHRVHGASETTAAIARGARAREDRALFARLWPKALAAPLALAYQWSYRGNRR